MRVRSSVRAHLGHAVYEPAPLPAWLESGLDLGLGLGSGSGSGSGLAGGECGVSIWLCVARAVLSQHVDRVRARVRVRDGVLG